MDTSETVVLIDLETQPKCNVSTCRGIASTSVCKPVGEQRTQYERSCYCNLKTGLSCAWWCPWDLWWETEDWLASQCPDAPATKPVDFSGLPPCARDCLDDAVFMYGCITQTSNCFCSNGNLFGCHEKCFGEHEWRGIERWLQGVCGIDENKAKEALATGSFSLWYSGTRGADKQLSVPPLPPLAPLSWDEIFVLTAASLIGAVGLVCWVYNCWAHRRRHKRRVKSALQPECL